MSKISLLNNWDLTKSFSGFFFTYCIIYTRSSNTVYAALLNNLFFQIIAEISSVSKQYWFYKNELLPKDYSVKRYYPFLSSLLVVK